MKKTITRINELKVNQKLNYQKKIEENKNMKKEKEEGEKG